MKYPSILNARVDCLCSLTRLTNEKLVSKGLQSFLHTVIICLLLKPCWLQLKSILMLKSA